MNEKKQKVIGVLTSGGDAPGMNAAVRAVVRTAIKKNMQVMGIRRGYNGLINGDMSEMNIRSVSNVLHRGGTMLLTARCNEFKTEEGQMQAVGVCKELGIDGLIIIGGDKFVDAAVAIAKQVAESMDKYMKSLPADTTPDPYADIPTFQTPTSDVLGKQEVK